MASHMFIYVAVNKRTQSAKLIIWPTTRFQNIRLNKAEAGFSKPTMEEILCFRSNVKHRKNIDFPLQEKVLNL